MYKRGIDVINRALKDFVAQDDAVTYLDCGPALLPDGKVNSVLLWDACSIHTCRPCILSILRSSMGGFATDVIH